MNAIEQAKKALEAARRFIRNGVEFGYIRMPDADTPDPAHRTLPAIESALAALQSQDSEASAIHRAMTAPQAAPLTDAEILDDARSFGMDMGDCIEFDEDSIIKFARAILSAAPAPQPQDEYETDLSYYAHAEEVDFPGILKASLAPVAAQQQDETLIAMREVAEEHAHGLALELECVLYDYSGQWYESALNKLSAYRAAMDAIHECESPTYMGEPVIPAAHPAQDKPQAGQARELTEGDARKAFTEMYGREPDIDGADWDWRGFRRGWVARAAQAAPAAPEGWQTAVEAMNRAKKLPVWGAINYHLHVEIDTIFKALAASPSAPAQTVPEGFAIVPIEPTPAMVGAGVENEMWSSYTAVRAIYRAMIAAASPVAQADQKGGE